MLPVRKCFSLVPIPDHKSTGQIQRTGKMVSRADVGSIETDAIQRPRATAYHHQASPCSISLSSATSIRPDTNRLKSTSNGRSIKPGILWSGDPATLFRSFLNRPLWLPADRAAKRSKSPAPTSDSTNP